MSKRTRREFLQTGAAAALGMMSAGALGCAHTRQTLRTTPGGRRPNIILILADDMGYSDIGCYGGEVLTPNLDRMAAGGLRFSRFYNTARCCPTRASLLTGLHPHQAGVGHMTWGLGPEHPGYRGDLNDQCVTIAEALQLAGYRTACVGKWHVNAPGSQKNMPCQRGFERFYGGAGNYFNPAIQIDNNPPVRMTDPEFFLTDAISDHTIRYMEEFRKEGDAPFFIHVAYSAPHWPLHAKPEDIAKYRQVYRKGWDRIREERYNRMIDMGLVDKRWPLSPRDEDVEPWAETAEKEWQTERMAVYAAQVDCMDQGIGRIWQKVKAMGEEDNTLFLFLSDNGGCAEEVLPFYGDFAFCPEKTPDGRTMKYGNLPSVMPGPADTFQSYGLPWANVSNTPYRLYKHWIHEGGIATPLIAYWPGVVDHAGALTHQPGHIVDIMATCLDAARAEYPAEYEGREITPLEGKSLMPVFAGRVRDGHSHLCWEHEGNKAVMRGNFKLVSRHPQQWELYDIEADRTEMYNLAEYCPDKVAELEPLYDAWAERCGVEPWEVVAPLTTKSFLKFMNLPEDWTPGA